MNNTHYEEFKRIDDFGDFDRHMVSAFLAEHTDLRLYYDVTDEQWVLLREKYVPDPDTSLAIGDMERRQRIGPDVRSSDVGTTTEPEIEWGGSNVE